MHTKGDPQVNVLLSWQRFPCLAQSRIKPPGDGTVCCQWTAVSNGFMLGPASFYRKMGATHDAIDVFVNPDIVQ